MTDEFFKVSEIARILNVCSATVIKLIRQNRLRGVQVGGPLRKSYRVYKKDLDRYMAEEYERNKNNE